MRQLGSSEVARRVNLNGATLPVECTAFGMDGFPCFKKIQTGNSRSPVALLELEVHRQRGQD